MKPFLLIAWDDYYPSCSTSDWIDTFASREDAEKEVEKIDMDRCIVKGCSYDRYDIIDLRNWINKP